MKKNLLFVIALCSVVFANTSIFNTLGKTTSLTLANVEAIAAKETVEDCNIFVYNRDEAETTQTGTVKSRWFGGFYTIIDGHEVGLGVDAGGNGSVKLYSCKVSTGNCCAKSWMEKPPYYY